MPSWMRNRWISSVIVIAMALAVFAIPHLGVGQPSGVEIDGSTIHPLTDTNPHHCVGTDQEQDEATKDIDKAKRAERLHQKGVTHQREGKYAQATKAYQAALALYIELRMPRDQALVLKKLGVVSQQSGQYTAALEFYRKALTIYDAHCDLQRIAELLSNIGAAYEQQGYYGSALTSYMKALSLFEQAGKHNNKNQGRLLNNIGLVYTNLGQYEKAHYFYESALKIRVEADDSAGRTRTLLNLGFMYRKQHLYQDAIKAYIQALELSPELGERWLVSILNNLGYAYAKMERHEEALATLQEALALAQATGNRGAEGRILDSIGAVYMGQQRYDAALDQFQRALLPKREVGDREGERASLANIGKVLAKQGLVKSAIIFYKQAVNVTEELREDLRGLTSEEREVYVATVDEAYRELAGLLFDEGRLAEALEVLTMLKEEEYFEYLRRRTDQDPRTTSLKVPGPEKARWKQYEEISEWTLPAWQVYRKLHSKEQTDRLTSEEQVLLEEAKKELKRADKHFRDNVLPALEDEYKESQAGEDFPQADELKAITAFQYTLGDLGPGTVAIYFLSLPDNLYIIVVGSDPALAPIVEKRPIGRKSLDRAILKYYSALQSPASEPWQAAQELYGHLIVPIAQVLEETRAETLLAYLDGNLRYVPLAALHDGRGYLAEKYAVVMYTPAAKDKLKDVPVARWRVAGMGVSTGETPLPAVEDELDGIVKEGTEDPRGVLPGKTFLNEQFTKKQLMAALQDRQNGGYTVLHLASHFQFIAGDMGRSFLVLGKDDKFRLADLSPVNYPLGNLDLLALSACRTGLDDTDSGDGREIEGFAALAQDSGAKAVLATLWDVSDRSTGKFMQLMYQLREEESLPKAEALRRAQVMFINGQALQGETTAKNSRGFLLLANESSDASMFLPAGRYAHPYYWAPFILMGNFL